MICNGHRNGLATCNFEVAHDFNVQNQNEYVVQCVGASKIELFNLISRRCPENVFFRHSHHSIRHTHTYKYQNTFPFDCFCFLSSGLNLIIKLKSFRREFKNIFFSRKKKRGPKKKPNVKNRYVPRYAIHKLYIVMMRAMNSHLTSDEILSLSVCM